MQVAGIPERQEGGKHDGLLSGLDPALVGQGGEISALSLVYRFARGFFVETVWWMLVTPGDTEDGPEDGTTPGPPARAG